MRIYRPPATMVVLGPAGKPEVELSVDACLADEIPVLRRHGGGCAVVLDPGNLVVSVAMPARGVGRITEHFQRLSRWLIRGLERAGAPDVYPDGISDLVFRDAKIGGSCIYRASDLLFYSSTLLVEPDIDRIERYLRHPPREPEYRRGRPHREFMGNLADGVGATSLDDLADALRHYLHPQDV
jgi:lipoate-protein ligase A